MSPGQLLEAADLDDEGAIRCLWSAQTYSVLSCGKSITWQQKKPKQEPHLGSHQLDAAVAVTRGGGEDLLERFLHDFQVLSRVRALVMPRRHLFRVLCSEDLYEIVVDNFWS